MRPALVVFDCDGTLVDSQRAIVACMAAAFGAERAEPPAAAAVRAVIGLPLAECVARLAPALAPVRRARVVEAYKEQFFVLRQRPDHDEPLFEGARDTLDRLADAGVKLGVATGKARRGLLAVLERHDLARRFVTLQTGDTGPGKPHPAMLERAMAEAGAAPGNTAMVGDTSFDMAMARAAGTAAIGVAWGYHPQGDLHAAGAHAVAGSFAALDALLERACG